MNKLIIACNAALVATALIGCGTPSTNSSSSSSSSTPVISSSVASSSSSAAPVVDFDVTTTSFDSDGPIPAKYTCQDKAFGDGVSPALTWTAGPAGTKSYAIAFKDMSIIQSGAQVQLGYHWVMWNIPANVRSLPESLSGEKNPPAMGGAEQKSAGTNGYSFFAPCPSWNYCTDNKKSTDSYSFVVYAIGQENITPSGNVQAIDGYLESIALETTEVRGTSDAAPACATPVLDGKALYAQHCAGCHGAAKQGATTQRIQNAINTYTFMQLGLSSEEINAIGTAF